MRLNYIAFLLLSVWCTACGRKPAPDYTRQAANNSTGKNEQASQRLTAFTEPFYQGLAIVRRQDGRQALINTKGDTIIPFGSHAIQVTQTRLATLDANASQSVFNADGRKVYECKNCLVYVDGILNRMYHTPKEYSDNGTVKNDSLIVVLDITGKEIFRRKGIYISRLDNEKSDTYTGEPKQLLPYYKVARNFANGLSDIVTLEGKPVLENISFTGFYSGIGYLGKNGKVAVIDTTFKEIIPMRYGYEFIRKSFGHPQQAYSVGKNGKYGFITPDNKIVLPLIYPYQVNYSPKGKAYTMYDSKQKGYYVFSMQGDTIITPDYYIQVGNMAEALFYKGVPVKRIKTNKVGIVGGDGRFIIPAEYNFISEARKGKLIFFKDGKAGYLDEKGKLLLSLDDCQRLSYFEDDVAACGIKIRNAGRENYPSAQVTYSTDEGPSVMQYRFINTTGKFLGEQAYDWVYPFRNGYAMVMKNSEHFLIDKNGNKVLADGKYPLISYFYKGYAIAYDPKNKKFGLVNDKLQLVVPVEYDEIATKQENSTYHLQLYTAHGYESNPGFTNSYADVQDGKLQVKKNGSSAEIALLR